MCARWALDALFSSLDDDRPAAAEDGDASRMDVDVWPNNKRRTATTASASGGDSNDAKKWRLTTLAERGVAASAGLTGAVEPDQRLKLRHQSEDTSVDLARLVRVTLSPNPADGVFQGLTPALRELSICDSPRFYCVSEYTNTFYRTPILRCRDALHIFRKLSYGADAAANLERLELVVRGTETEIEDEMELYAFVAAACPRLHVLELHRYRNVLDPRDASVAVPLARQQDAIADGLQGFRSISYLRLNLDLPQQRHTIDSYFRFLDELDVHAERVARALPWLDAIVLLHENFADRYAWQPWTVLPGGGVLRSPEPHYIERHVSPSCDARRWLTTAQLRYGMDATRSLVYMLCCCNMSMFNSSPRAAQVHSK
ncbi:hypothetical protein AURDEDRAFT_129358 [Auricularia subglabra TFB-10046 SS5]|uniref:F-box domain-containing protein n=1 Tax=Auricularia subglabra (strain TFB-10046 / SS5) TaxID=717982 RepID=J0D068_AURST|nr:hypothetical protein AURDEDRAFT_129358 [Auricularia subglabra TFB-10046 SS5]